jgi:oligosaccharyl transferase (archaeosortase A-associated)
MSRFHININSTRTKYGLALAAIFGIALFLRVYFPYHNVFPGGWVNFQENDAWYHMRNVTNLVHHFPHLSLIDPYGLYPGGQPVRASPFFELFLGFFVWIIGLGSPSSQVIGTVGAYFPAVLGALITVPVYFIGKELFSKKVGLLAAALAAILPGQFLWRTMLGYPDQHVVEILFSTVTLLFLILAVKSSSQKGLSFKSLWTRDWGSLRNPLLYSILGGIFLGCYLTNWAGGLLLAFVVSVFVVVQYIIDHLKGRSTDYLCIISVPLFLLALFIVIPTLATFSGANLQVKSLLIGILAFLVLSGFSRLFVSRDIKRVYYPLALGALGGIGVGIFYLVDASLFHTMISRFSVFAPEGGMLTIAEAQGLSLSTAWQMFTTDFYLALVSLVLIIYLVAKEGSSTKTLLLVWSLIVLVATFGQNRFAYYYAVNVALLTAYLPWRALNFVGLWKTSGEAPKQADIKAVKLEKEKTRPRPAKKSKRKKAQTKRQTRGTLVTQPRGATYAYSIVAIVVVFFLIFYPNIGLAIDRVSANTGVDPDWHDALVWMGQNTPKPFQNPDSYYALYQSPPSGQSYDYPASAYGVMSWWDYGYWITSIAHRIPNASPNGQNGAVNAGLFFTAQDESSANQLLDELGSKYVIIDSSMVIGKFYAMAIWAGKSQSQFFDVYYQSTQTGGFQAVMLYYPEYYQSMSSRLYLFGCEGWVPQQVTAISWKQQQLTASDGSTFTAKVISDQQTFSSYNTAKAFVDTHTNYRIVSSSPISSPVPLDKLENYKLIYQSPTTIATQQTGNISEVEIFQYSP